MITKIVTVTPDIAKTWLSVQQKNRNIQPLRVAQYAALMRAGRWRITTDAIGLTAEGGVINGQHRLRAVITANMPVDMLVAFGVEEEVFDVIDQGAKRTRAQVLKISGASNGSALAAVVSAVLQIRGLEYQKITAQTVNSEYADNHEQYDRITALYVRVQKSDMAGMQAGVCGWYLAEQDKKDAVLMDRFVHALLYGAEMELDDAVMVFRRYYHSGGKQMLTCIRKRVLAYHNILNVLYRAWTRNEKWRSYDKIRRAIKDLT